MTARDLQLWAERELERRCNAFLRREPDHDRHIEALVRIAEHFRELADADELAGLNPDGMMFVETRRGGFAAPLYERKAKA